jgi:hypothetical protein
MKQLLIFLRVPQVSCMSFLIRFVFCRIFLVQRSIQRRRQQQKSLDSFLININHEDNFTTNDIEILYRSINDHSLLHLTELDYNQILVLTCDNERNYRDQLANTSIWLCTTLNEVRINKIFRNIKVLLFRLIMIFFNVF